MGRALGAKQARGPVRFGVVGLGVGTLAAYTVYKLVVSARARRKAILFLIGVIVVIVLNALERWLLW